MQDSIFTKIFKGDVPGEIIYQDELCFVILSIEPISEGHMLVIPRAQIDHLWDVDTDTYHHLFDVAKQMKEKLIKAYPAYERIGLQVEGFGVPHAHIHIFGYEKPMEQTMVDIHEWKKTVDSPFTPVEKLHPVAEKLRAV